MNILVRIAAAVGLVALGAQPVSAAQAGALDPTFGVGGKRTVVAPGGVDSPKTVRDDAGRIYLMQSSQNNPEPDALEITRLHHDGALDTSFGEQGTVVNNLPQSFYDVTAAAMQSDGRFLAGFQDTANNGLKVCRFLADGSFDPTFGLPATPGCTDVGPELLGPNAMLVQPDGRIALTGNISAVRGFVARLEADGRLDQDFGDGGIFTTGPDAATVFYAIASAPNGDIVVAGDIGNVNSDFVVMRLAGEDGQPVETFGSEGVVTTAFDAANNAKHDVAFAVAVLPDGGIVAAGYAATNLKGNLRPAVVKLTGSGAPDVSFGPGGKRLYDPCAIYAFGCELRIHDLAVLPDERLVLAGSISPAQNYYNYDFLAMRLLANGEPDPDFGHPTTPGMVTVPFNLGPNEVSPDVARVVMLEGERILLSGTARVTTDDPQDAYHDDYALARLDHGLNQAFTVTPAPGPGGALSPAAPQQIGHSDRAEFVVQPAAGHTVAAIGTASGDCGGGMDGEVYVTAPVIASCTARIAFKQIEPAIFSDSFE